MQSDLCPKVTLYNQAKVGSSVLYIGSQFPPMLLLRYLFTLQNIRGTKKQVIEVLGTCSKKETPLHAYTHHLTSDESLEEPIWMFYGLKSDIV